MQNHTLSFDVSRTKYFNCTKIIVWLHSVYNYLCLTDNLRNQPNGVDYGHEQAKNQSNRYHGEDVDGGHNIKYPIPIEMTSGI